MGKFNKYRALERVPPNFLKCFRHKFDKRGAKEEGALAAWLATLTRSFVNGTEEEDYNGIDGWDDGDGVDYKGRKDCPPNTMYMEITKAGGTEFRSGWVYQDKYIYALMVYSEDNVITNIKFGKVHCSDLKKIVEEKVDLDSRSTKDTLYEVYYRTWEGQHRGNTTLLTYSDVESCPSFESVPLPKEFWHHVEYVYQYSGIK